ncbi:phosphoglucosamine mutase [Desulfamplus magnetovallimortis]|nr:phosphoglucosamine mutase [Desulfamplus magnetovallimortis]
MKKLFGTDGIRGLANHYPMTSCMAMKIGMAVAQFVKKNGDGIIVIGKDTRISGDMLESALAAGIASVGVDVLVSGVIPTPGVAFLISDIEDSEAGIIEDSEAGIIEDSEAGIIEDAGAGIIEGAGAGIVISASHNPWQDNGIKIFKKGGYKLSDDEEFYIESRIAQLSLQQGDSEDVKNTSHTGRIKYLSDAPLRYCQFLKKTFKPLLQGDNKKNCNAESSWLNSTTHPDHENHEGCFYGKRIRIVVDCSNGAATTVAPLLFTKPFFEAHFIHKDPDGKNINHNCGSQHTESLAEAVLKLGADLGIALDGDADRLIAVDETGKTVTGDTLLAICAAHAKTKGRLVNNKVVSTVMSNIGFIRAMNSIGIEHLVTDVGDREVLKEMRASGAVMGGEDSGHMIFSQYHTTGDGLLSSLRLIEVMMETGKALSELASIMKVYPQILMNVTVDASRPDFMAIKKIADEIGAVENELGDDGRVLVRYSGTQPLLRVMVEGPEKEITEMSCQRICRAIRENIKYP